MTVTTHQLAEAFGVAPLAFCRHHPDQLGQYLAGCCPICDRPYGIELEPGTETAPPFGRAVPGSDAGEAQTLASTGTLPPGGDSERDIPVPLVSPGHKAGETALGRQGAGAPVLRWGRRHMRPARIVWVTTGRKTLASILKGAKAQPAELVRIFLVGDRPGGGSGDPAGFHKWATAPDGWEEGGHYLHDLMVPLLRYSGAEGQRVEVMRAASWWGEQDPADPYTTADCAAAWQLLGDGLALVPDSRRRPTGAQLLRTPSATGRHLLQQLIPDGVAWPVMAPDVQQLIRSTSGQGRFEVFNLPNAPAEIPALHKRDMTLAYAAVAKQLPVGPARHLRYRTPKPLAEVWEGRDAQYWPARYLIRAKVPGDWGHVGLLPQMADGGGWEWPSAPGADIAGWVGGAELQVAFRQGWPIDVVEVLAMTPTDGTGPLGRWTDALVRLRDHLGRVDDKAAGLAKNGVRSILLQSIGAFHGTRHRVTKIGTVAEAFAGGFAEGDRTAPQPLADGLWTWSDKGQQAWPEMAWPAWSAGIWDRVRARVAKQLLKVPASAVVAAQLDAVYLTSDPGWEADGRPGSWKAEGTLPGPLPRPTTLAQLRRLQRGAW